MPGLVSEDDFVSILRQVVGGRHSGKPLFFWQGDVAQLRTTMANLPDLEGRVAWLDANQLAEDVIPRRAREVLRTKLERSLQQFVESGIHVLVVESPWLLLRYEPAAPLAALWNTFVSSGRAVVVVLPRPVPRPLSLPQYIRFRGDAPATLFADGVGGSVVADSAGGVES